MQYSLLDNIIEEENLLHQILHTRGVEDIPRYLNPSSEDLNDPELLDNIEDGAILLETAIGNNHNILIVVDSDADGYTSAAALINYLYDVYNNDYIESHIQYVVHTGKQHGLILEEIPDDIQLIILPDSSSSDVEQHKWCYEHDIKVLVLDHHQSDVDFSDYPYAVVINNQLCDYPNKTLSGVGVVYKFLQYLDKRWNKNYADNQLGLVSCGLIGDVMDIRNYETHYLISQGLKHFHKNPFLHSAVIKTQYSIDRNGGFNNTAVAFYIVPLINGCIRMGDQKDKITLFESMLLSKGNAEVPSTKRGAKIGEKEVLSEQAVRICSNLKNKQNKLRDDCLEQISQKIKSNSLLNNKVLFIEVENFDKNLTGLLANKVADTYQRPTLIVQKRGDSYGGSGRNFSHSPLTDFKKLCADSNASLAQGHPNAFGFAIDQQEKEIFVEKTNQALEGLDLSKTFKVDKIFESDYDLDGLIDIGFASFLWGEKIEEPYFAFREVAVTRDNLQLLSPDKSPTIKLTINGLEFIKFQAMADYETLNPDNPVGATIIDIVGTASINEFGGQVKPQIRIVDYNIIRHEDVFF